MPNGCIIADGVVIGEGARLRNFERVSKKRGASSKAVGDGSDGDDEDDEDSELEEIEARKFCLVSFLRRIILTSRADQEDAARILGKDSNALVWPRGSPADDEDELDEREHYNNLRLMRIGTCNAFANADYTPFV